MKKYSGIYKITNLSNGDFYIGQSVDLTQRKHSHFCQLRKGLHGNTYLQNSFNKYGEKKFEFSIVLLCDPIKSILSYYEQSLVDAWSPEYNICKKCVDSSLGVERSYDFKQNLCIKKVVFLCAQNRDIVMK